jgi:prepilin-type N-terminal cleavage/methylation domain-containing protein
MLGALRRNGTRRARGLTMVEMMVVVAIAAVILTLTAPSMRDFLARQRVAAINAELVTDLQLARSEAIARNRDVQIVFRVQSDAMTCYTIQTTGTTSGRCDCRKPIGSACLNSDGTPVALEVEEIKTVQVDRSTTVTLLPPEAPGHVIIFSRTRGLVGWGTHDVGNYAGQPDPFAALVAGWADFMVGVESSRSGKLRTQVNIAGRPQVCSPDGSMRGVAACAD